MCNRFIKSFVEQVVHRTEHIQCKSGYYKSFDRNLLKFIGGKVNYKREIEESFYLDLCLYFLHQEEVKNFIEILKVLHIYGRLELIQKISTAIKSHYKCIPEFKDYIVFPDYDNISWVELSYMTSDTTFYGDKKTIPFNKWLDIFLQAF
tara:strand:- start:782 stop:1228 length:447 start_codon:yes stop_codon:yes gene_type:complete